MQMPPNPRMKTDAQQRRCAPLFRAAYAHRSVYLSPHGMIGPHVKASGRVVAGVAPHSAAQTFTAPSQPRISLHS